jgi:sulfide dehydrogenase [flavocytochrome c] flavoprotein subunit
VSGINRRKLLKASLAAAGAATLPCAPAVAQGAAPHVVVIGGGFGGAACARALRKADPRLRVTLVEGNKTFVAAPHSNSVIAGLRDLELQTFGYERIADDGIAVMTATATAIDAAARTVALSAGGPLPYDRLVLSPGIAFRWEAIDGYDALSSSRMPHAFVNSEQIALLSAQLADMPDGGVVAIAAPVNPARCPPAPYERASLIAHYLKTKRPRSKVLILDAKDSFTMQRQFQAAWKELYPGLLEWVPLSSGGLVTSVDMGARTVTTDFDSYKVDVASIIPPQHAGEIAITSGVADRTGWCPIDPVTFESKLQPNIHVIGDAAIGGAMPKSASAAVSEAKLCAGAIVALLRGETPAAPTLESACYSVVAPDYAISIKGRYRVVDGQFMEIEGAGGTSPPGADAAQRAAEAHQADDWYRTITHEVFG